MIMALNRLRRCVALQKYLVKQSVGFYYLKFFTYKAYVQWFRILIITAIFFDDFIDYQILYLQPGVQLSIVYKDWGNGAGYCKALYWQNGKFGGV